MSKAIEGYIKSWLYNLDLTSRLTHEVAKQFFEKNKFPINLDEYIILDTLLENPGILQLKLAKLILKGRAHTGRFLMGLEEKGYIKRIPSKKGERLVMKSEVTEKGKLLHNEIANKIKILKENCSNLVPQDTEEKLQAILKTIREAITKQFDIKFE